MTPAPALASPATAAACMKRIDSMATGSAVEFPITRNAAKTSGPKSPAQIQTNVAHQAARVSWTPTKVSRTHSDSAANGSVQNRAASTGAPAPLSEASPRSADTCARPTAPDRAPGARSA